MLGDTHVEPHAEPLPRSNRRVRAIVAMINAHRPDLVIHLGDLVHPPPGLPGHAPAIAAVKEILAGLEAPLHVLPGNHDIGDKPSPWMPAKAVRADWLEAHNAAFGATPAIVDHGDISLLLLNAPLLNSGLAAEAVQWAYMKQQLASRRGRRLLVFLHYPPFLVTPDEPGHYDNLDEPARGRLLALLRRHGAEAVLAGHVHNLFLHADGDMRIYVAPSTSFVRRDYAEMFRIGPLAEHGREDPAKLGFLLLEVLETGHRVRFVRLDESSALPTPWPEPCPLGVELRHPWAELVELPMNPPTDAFQRRRVRNDYPVWALLELGIQKLRVPLADLIEPRTRERMALLHAMGRHFTVLAAGVPDEAAQVVLADHRELVRALEIVLPDAAVLPSLPAIAAMVDRTEVLARLAPLRSNADRLSGTTNLDHELGQGFGLGEIDRLEAMMALPGARKAFRGAVLTLPSTTEPGPALAAVRPRLAALGLDLALTIGLIPPRPDATLTDHASLRARVLATLDGARAHPELDVFLDSFMDIDRGYFVRHGLIDRRGTPRLDLLAQA